MPYRIQRGALALAIGLTATTFAPASFAVLFDQNVTPDVIFGSGNANGSYTVDRNSGVELAARQTLPTRARLRTPSTATATVLYSFAAHASRRPSSSPTAVWSFEWSINTDFDGSTGLNLDALTYALGLDTDPSLGTAFIAFDPIMP